MRRVQTFALVLMPFAAGAHADVSPAEWIEHVDRDLAALWMQDGLAGTPAASFPTFRCFDERHCDVKAPSPELACDAVAPARYFDSRESGLRGMEQMSGGLRIVKTTRAGR